MKATFLTNCVCCPGPAPGEAIGAMVDQATEIRRRTFRQHVDLDSLREVEESLGYERFPSRGMTMAGDWHVSYHKSVFRGVPCVYFRHSAIEYIFTEAGR